MILKRVHPLVWILLLAFGVRLLGIIARPIWYDEAFSLLFTAKGPAAMLHTTLATDASGAAEEHPLGYYFLFWGFRQLFGSSIISARLFSVIAGLLTVALIYLGARDQFNERVGISAALCVAFAPFHIHYSQEIRMYGWLAFWLTLATLAFARVRKTAHTRWWIVFTLACAAAQYTHSLAAFYLAPLALSSLFTLDWKFIRAVGLSGAAALLLYVPWLIHVPTQFAKISTNYWTARPDVARIFTTLLSFVTNLPLPDQWLLPGLGITLLVIAFAAWQTFQAFRARALTWQWGLWFFYLAFFPPALLFLFSQWRPIYIERALLPSAGMFCVWLTWTVYETGLPKVMRTILIGLLVVAFGMGIYQHVNYAGFPYAPYAALDQSLAQEYQPGDVIIHSSKLSLLPALYFNVSLPQIFIADPPGSDVDTLAPATQQVLGLTSAPDIERAANHAPRVWLIIFKQSNAEYTDAGQPTHPHVAWMQDHYQLVHLKQWADLIVYEFKEAGAP